MFMNQWKNYYELLGIYLFSVMCAGEQVEVQNLAFFAISGSFLGISAWKWGTFSKPYSSLAVSLIHFIIHN